MERENAARFRSGARPLCRNRTRQTLCGTQIIVAGVRSSVSLAAMQATPGNESLRSCRTSCALFARSSRDSPSRCTARDQRRCGGDWVRALWKSSAGTAAIRRTSAALPIFAFCIRRRHLGVVVSAAVPAPINIFAILHRILPGTSFDAWYGQECRSTGTTSQCEGAFFTYNSMMLKAFLLNGAAAVAARLTE